MYFNLFRYSRRNTKNSCGSVCVKNKKESFQEKCFETVLSKYLERTKFLKETIEMFIEA